MSENNILPAVLVDLTQHDNIDLVEITVSVNGITQYELGTSGQFGIRSNHPFSTVPERVSRILNKLNILSVKLLNPPSMQQILDDVKVRDDDHVPVSVGSLRLLRKHISNLGTLVETSPNNGDG